MSQRDESASDTYRFHTTILLVNREIYKEAIQTLRTNNFIVVSHEWELLTCLKHRLSVPIVTENKDHVARYKLHDARVHINAPSTSIFKSKQPAAFLMLSHDLPTFTRMISRVLCTTPTLATLITHLDRTPPHSFVSTPPNNHARNAINVKIQFQPTIVDNHQACKDMLEPFRATFLAGDKFKVLNAAAPLKDYTENLTKTVQSKTAWNIGIAWHIIDMLKALKAQADCLTRAGDLQRASTLYTSIWSPHRGCPILNLDPKLYQSDLGPAVARICCVMMDAAMTDAFARIRMGRDLVKLEQALIRLSDCLTNRLPKAIAEQIMENEEDSKGPANRGWLTLLVSFVSRRSKQNLQNHLLAFEGIQRIMPDDEYFLHDLALVRLTAQNKKVRIVYDLVTNRS